ncbi:MAG: hypothetical protein IID45_04675, partial [Planctomycetes bacterium]|nr:hypothetical protein [Planctomycetota bacterium]
KTRAEPRSTAEGPPNKIGPIKRSKGVSPASVAGAGAGAEGVMLLRGPNGELVPLPKNVTMKELLEWLRNRQETKYAVNSVILEGSADDRKAVLTATVTVQISDDRGWVRVPLGFNEADLSGSKYVFLGAHLGMKKQPAAGGAAVFDRLTREFGYRWWFHGEGYHRLTLSLVLPVTGQMPTRRLKLTIPQRTAASTLLLKVPMRRVTVSRRRRSGTAPTSKPLKGSVSQIEVIGLNGHLDLQWREAARRTLKVLQAETAILLNLSGESIMLTAEQRVRALKGTFSTIEVQLPAGYKVLAVSGKYYKNHTVDTQQRAVVELTGPRTDWTKIRWTLERTFSVREGPLTVDGFEVDRARLQAGEVALVKMQGFQITKREGDNRSVHRIGVSRFTARELVGASTIAVAFRFLKQPFLLHLNLARVAPQFTTDPRLTLQLKKGRMEIAALFEVNVSPDGGGVQNLEIHWPKRLAEGWEQLVLTMPSGVRKEFVVTNLLSKKKSGDLPIRVRFSQPQTGKFQLLLLGSRRFDPSGKPSSLTLPWISGGTRLPTILDLLHDENMEVQLKPGGETSLQEIPVDSEPKGSDTAATRRFRIEENLPQELSIAVKIHARTVRAETSVNALIRNGMIRVTQKIQYDVAYGSLAEVRFVIPQDLIGRVDFYAADGSPLKPSGAGLDVGEQQKIALKLAAPQRGRFFLTAAYSVRIREIAAGRNSLEVALPLVRCDEFDFVVTRLSTQESDRFDVTPSGDHWQPINTPGNLLLWQSNESLVSIPLQIVPRRIPRASSLTIRRALIKTAIDSEGRARSRAQYRIEGKTSIVVLIFPSEIIPESFWWGREKLSAEQSESPGGDSVVIRLQIPSGAKDRDGSHLLTADYHTRKPVPFRWWGSHSLAAPRFPGSTWIEQTVWEIHLPDDHHLLSHPRGFIPRFSWQRETVFWSRLPDAAAEDGAAWISAGDGPAAREEFALGNSYQFSRFGPVESIEFDSMGRSLIVLFGAGLAWAIGILMVRIPFLRSLSAILSAALLMAVAALWYLVPVQVLLQPAIFGLLLAGIFVWIERRMKRRSEPSVLTISHPSDYLISSPDSSKVAGTAARMAGSEDPTMVRVAAGTVAEPASTSEVKSDA